MTRPVWLILAALLVASPAFARCDSCPRDSYGRIKRSESAKRQFEKMTGHPHGWPGHVVDHIIPLACDGKDDPSNMQWEQVTEAKAKDAWELKECRNGQGCCFVSNIEVDCNERLVRTWPSSKPVHGRIFHRIECYSIDGPLPAGDYIVYGQNGEVRAFYVDGLRYTRLP